MLYAHQKNFLTKTLDKSALVWSCGTGKTRTAIEWAIKGIEKLPYSDYPLLIICPKALKTNWKNEYIKANFPTTPLILTKEEFRRDAHKLEKYDQVIVDEVHMGFLTPLWKSQMSKALKKYLEIHKVDRVLLLSATPYTSSPWNVYNLAWLIGHHWNWRMFRLKYFFDVRMGPRIIPMAKKGCEKELALQVKKIADVVDIHDIMDVPLQFHAEPEYFSLNREQDSAIEDAYDPLPIVRYTKEHEIEQGVILDDLSSRTIPCDKMERLKALVEENPKIAIVCRYNAQIDAVAEALSEYNPFIIRGATKDRHSICEQCEASKKAVVLIQADCAEGYQLPSFPLCVFASQSYSYVKWEQICGRFLRMDKPSRTTFLYLLTEGDSIDQAVYNAVKKKEDFKIELFRKKK